MKKKEKSVPSLSNRAVRKRKNNRIVRRAHTSSQCENTNIKHSDKAVAFCLYLKYNC